MNTYKKVIKVLTFCMFCLAVINSCEESEKESLEDELAITEEEVELTASSSYDVSYIDLDYFNESPFDNGSMAPFEVCTTAGGNTATVENGQVKCYWAQINYNLRETRSFSGAEICSPIAFREETFVGFDVNIPSTEFPYNRNTTITQILSANGCSSWSAMLEIRGNDLYINHRSACVDGTEENILPNIPRDQWLSFQLRYVPSGNNTGAIEVLYNGSSIYSQSGINFAWGDFNPENVLDSSVENNFMQIKYGMYCHDASEYVEDDSADDDTRTIYLDNVSVRQGSDGWDHVDPNL